MIHIEGLAVHHDPNARRQDARSKQALRQILQPVRSLESQRCHGAGEDDRVLYRTQMSLQQPPGGHHRVSTMRDHHRSVRQPGAHGIQYHLAIGIRHIEAVFVHERGDIDFHIRQPQLRKVAIDFRQQILDLPALLGVDLLHRAAGGNEMNLHTSNPQVYRQCHTGNVRAAAILLTCAWLCSAQDARSLVARAVATDDHSYRLARNYTYKIHDEIQELNSSGGVKSVHSTVDEVLYVGGKTYLHPLEKDGKPLPEKEAQKEQAKLDRAVEEASRLSEAERAKRIEEQEHDIAKRRAQFKEIPDAFDYTLVGDAVIAGRGAWEISAKPRADYHGELHGILRNLEGTLWIDKQDYSWVKFEAEVLKPFSIGWFLARVGEGTHLSYELMPVGTQDAAGARKTEFWVPKSIALRASARLALVRRMNVEQKITFSDYRRFQTDSRIVPTEE